MAEVADDAARDRAIRRYGQLEERFAALGGYGAESEAGRICASLGLPERVLTQQLRTLSGGQRRRVELARILFAASDSGAGCGAPRCCSTSRPTTSTPIRWAGCGISCATTPAGWWYQPQRRPAGRRGQPGLVPRRGARRSRRLQHGLAEVPRRPRHRRAAPPPRTRQRRTQGHRAARPGRKARRQSHQSRCGTEYAAPRRPDDGRTRRRAGGRQGGPDQVPEPRRRADAHR